LYDKIRKYWRELREFALRKSIEKALREQGLSQLANKLSEIVPDILHQYSAFKVDTLYLTKKVRGQHAFQISLVQEAINILKRSAKDDLTIADIGDSAGTHIQYIRSLFSYQNIRTISINLDPEAVKRIKERGFEAICARAEEIGEKYNITADIFLCFETLEHLMNPAEFLYKLSIKTKCKLFVITVPYLRSSRVGLHQIRNLNKQNLSRKKIMSAENTHIFELSPEDLQLLFKFAGWSVVFERIYLQYPRKHWLRITKNYWRMFDFEGFYGVILKKDSTWSKLYTGW
jgi:2-polyprenyl-3-methyl-5-hydroxy-6-metoxy-1,4-benzoquinol methylase